MGLFDDDFYSTKVSRRGRKESEIRWGRRGFRSRNGGAGLMLAAAGGVILTLAIVLPLTFSGNGHSGTRTAGQVASASATSGTGDETDQVPVAAEKVKPAVVSVLSTRGSVDGDPQGGFGQGIGSGVVYMKDGNKARIVTNNHVVDQATKLEVVMANGDRKKATLLGKDAISDLAVLEVDASGIKTVAEFGDSDKLKYGELAIAIGNPLGLGYSVTRGVISSPHRVLPISLAQDGNYDWELDVIQTDAAINQGNSGGPLADIHGKVVGINSMKVSETGVEGVGFALPINAVKPVLDQLVKDGKVKRPYMGISSVELGAYVGKEGADVLKLPDNVKKGIIVLEAKGPAASGGLKLNDVIVELDGTPIDSTLALRKFLYNEKQIGDKVKVTYYRAGKKDTTTVTLSENPN